LAFSKVDRLYSDTDERVDPVKYLTSNAERFVQTIKQFSLALLAEALIRQNRLLLKGMGHVGAKYQVEV